MSKTSLLVLSLSTILFTPVFATVPNTDKPDTFLGPVLRGTVTHGVDHSAYSFLGELAPRNLRMGATMGWEFSSTQRFKVSAEYLLQNIDYAFFSGNTDQWVHQGAIGAAYQYGFNPYTFDYHPQIDISAYYSYAPTKKIGYRTGTFENKGGMVETYIDYRRIAGSNAAGILPEFSFRPWPTLKAGIGLNYDNVHYHTTYSADDVNAKGLGGTLRINQLFSPQVDIDLLAQVRQPFNHYVANLNWNEIAFAGTWSLSVNAGYSIGKQGLPTTYEVGLALNYFMEGMSYSDNHRDAIDAFLNVKDEINISSTPSVSQQQASYQFQSWVAEPAVYMPQVLALTDEKVSSELCTPPTVAGSLPNPFIISAPSFTLNMVPYFMGTHLTYTLTLSNPPAAPATLTMTNGMISGANLVEDYMTTMVIVASNACGTKSITTQLRFTR